MSVRLYIGNLPETVDRKELDDTFSPAIEESATVKLITDRKTGKCRGFGFLTLSTEDLADIFIEKYNGCTFKEVTLRIERAQPRPTKPTAGPVITRDQREGGELEEDQPQRDPQREVIRKPRPVLSSQTPAPTPMPSNTPKPVVIAKQKEQAPQEQDPEVETSESSGEPRGAAPRPTLRRSTQTPATKSSGTKAKRSTSRPRSLESSNSYQDLKEAGDIDPRWAVLLEAKKQLQLTV